METAAKILFRSLSAVYGGAISSSALQPDLYFQDNKRTNVYYGIRLHDLISSRLVVRLFSIGNEIILDLLWLVDDSNIKGNHCVTYDKSSKEIQIEADAKSFVKKLKNDAIINATFSDLAGKTAVFEKTLVGSLQCYPKQIVNELMINVQNMPTILFAISRCRIKRKLLTKDSYVDSVINTFLAIIDLVHRTFELNNALSRDKNASSIFCIRCGYKLPKNSFYCAFCGSKQE